MPFDGNEFKKEYTSDDDVESDDGAGKDYVEIESDIEENIDSKLSSDVCSDNWSIYGMPAIRFILVKCMKDTFRRVTFLLKLLISDLQGY